MRLIESDGSFRALADGRWAVLPEGWALGALETGVLKPFQYDNLFERIGRETGQAKHNSKMLY